MFIFVLTFSKEMLQSFHILYIRYPLLYCLISLCVMQPQHTQLTNQPQRSAVEYMAWPCLSPLQDMLLQVSSS